MKRLLPVGLLTALPLLAGTAPAAPAAAVANPVVAELFTSQSCSSCPPADALLSELAQTEPDLLALDFHVDYWDRLGWKDPYSSAAATLRQQRYAADLGSEVYTPQLVIDGRRQVVGSNRVAVVAALAAARGDRAHAATVMLRLAWQGRRMAIDVGAGTVAAGAGTGRLWLVGFDDRHTTWVGRGENAGRRLTEVNVVRSWREVGTWNGTALHLAADPIPGQRNAALLQAPDGRILAAAILPTAG